MQNYLKQCINSSLINVKKSTYTFLTCNRWWIFTNTRHFKFIFFFPPKQLANERESGVFYFNLFIQKGTFHSHTCIRIVTIDGRINDLKNLGGGGGEEIVTLSRERDTAFGSICSLVKPSFGNKYTWLVELRTPSGFLLTLSDLRPVILPSSLHAFRVSLDDRWMPGKLGRMWAPGAGAGGREGGRKVAVWCRCCDAFGRRRREVAAAAVPPAAPSNTPLWICQNSATQKLHLFVHSACPVTRRTEPPRLSLRSRYIKGEVVWLQLGFYDTHTLNEALREE